MLATSSSDEDDYDLKKKPQQQIKSSTASSTFKQQSVEPGSSGLKQNNASFSSNRGNQLNVTGATQAMSNMHLMNGCETLSTRSSFSNSTSNEFLNNRNTGCATGASASRTNSKNSANVFNSNRNSSFKSNSSSSTMSGVTLIPNNQNSTPRVNKIENYF